MGRLIKTVLLLVVIGFLGLTGYAYLGDMTPKQSDVVQPVQLNGN